MLLQPYAKHSHSTEAHHQHVEHQKEMSAEEELLRRKGFSSLTCDYFKLKDEVYEQEFDRLSWFTRRCSPLFEGLNHIRGIATK
ncbi:unnamed protein product [Notodromas monacha]|uniref:Uncharacterized protein n=1 Tax=Notodromas monacha TaxID=399045 RepID=A0A7R9GJM6_9CRUS|nr:unnamed protein product [Notodromas monacha]CAG0925020.1 unnamed protein product [Notodromas monacha]